jgi:sulfonate dioxygenase
VYDTTTKFPPTEPFEFHDRGLDADKDKPNLLKAEGVTATKLTPRTGTEVRGIQLSQLNDAQRNELALLIAERGVVVFRDQDFKDSMSPQPYGSETAVFA